jgi:hypothetical protein
MSLLYHGSSNKDEFTHTRTPSPGVTDCLSIPEKRGGVEANDGAKSMFAKNVSSLSSSPTASTSGDSDNEKRTDVEVECDGTDAGTAFGTSLKLQIPSCEGENVSRTHRSEGTYDFLKDGSSSAKSPRHTARKHRYDGTDEPWLSPCGTFYGYKELPGVSPGKFRKAFEEQLNLVDDHSEDDDFDDEGVFYGDLDDVICGDLGDAGDNDTDYSSPRLSAHSIHGRENRSGKDTTYALNLLLSESPPN